jgi:hypothetical protein
MGCKLSMTLISEAQEGNIGEDWKYQLEVEVQTGGSKGAGSISVPKHNLPSGEIRAPHGAPAPQVIFDGVCEDHLRLHLKLTATEVDIFINDVGKLKRELTIECPGPAGGTVTKELDLAVPVREMPPILPKKALFTLRVRFTLRCG